MGDSKVIPQFIPYWGIDEVKAVNIVLSSDYLNEHKTVRKFEEEFAKFVGARYCVTVTSGTIALFCALSALSWHNRKVYIPAHDGIFAHNALLAVNAIPLVSDVNKHGLLEVDMEQNIVGSVVVQANGRISKNVPILEDCSQAVDHHTLGKVSTYSFASTKHITTGGQGGAICTDDDDIFELLTRIKDHGRNDRQSLKPMSDNYNSWGLNFKFTEIQAAFGLGQLKSLPKRIKRFKEIYSIYRDILEKHVTFDELPPRWYVDIFVEDPEKIIEKLKEKKIFCRRYPKPLNQQKVAEGYLASNSFVNADTRYNCGLYLPSTTNLSDEDVKYIAGEIKNAIS